MPITAIVVQRQTNNFNSVSTCFAIEVNEHRSLDFSREFNFDNLCVRQNTQEHVSLQFVQTFLPAGETAIN